ncbi:MAG: hypothetical protein PHX25_00450 [Candidatus Pacebacteria bacterium]|nr:hypothetical protein [Candidatus Paceibacterota bacterium]
MKNVAIFLGLVFVAFLTINHKQAAASYSKNGCYILVVQVDSTVDVFEAENREESTRAQMYFERDFRFVEVLKYCEGTRKYNKINNAIKNKQVYFFPNSEEDQTETF